MPIKIKAAVVIGAVLSVVATVAAAAGTRSNGPTAPTRSGTTSPTKAGTTCGTESCNPLPYKDVDRVFPVARKEIFLYHCGHARG